MIEVKYLSGESRYEAGKVVDYMSTLRTGVYNEDGEEVELYAEAENPTWNTEKEEFDDELATYDELKAAILEQAAEHGIPASELKFWLDEEQL